MYVTSDLYHAHYTLHMQLCKYTHVHTQHKPINSISGLSDPRGSHIIVPTIINTIPIMKIDFSGTLLHKTMPNFHE